MAFPGSRGAGSELVGAARDGGQEHPHSRTARPCRGGTREQRCARRPWPRKAVKRALRLSQRHEFHLLDSHWLLFAKFLVERLGCSSFMGFSDFSSLPSPFPYERDLEVILLRASKWQMWKLLGKSSLPKKKLIKFGLGCFIIFLLFVCGVFCLVGFQFCCLCCCALLFVFLFCFLLQATI